MQIRKKIIYGLLAVSLFWVAAKSEAGQTIDGALTLIGSTSPGALAQGNLNFGSKNGYSIYGGADYLGLLFHTNSEERFRISSDGKVGIGTKDPQSKLHIDGVLTLTGSTSPGALAQGNLNFGSINGYSIYGGADYLGLLFHTNGEERFRISSDGNVGIGTKNPGIYKLAVAGKIHAQEVTVDTIGWADYVFADNYKLMPLHEVEKRIKADKHLPGVPSATEVEKKGLNMGEMQNKLLEKVEELTLYMIDLKKENDALKKRIASLEEK